MKNEFEVPLYTIKCRHKRLKVQSFEVKSWIYKLRMFNVQQASKHALHNDISVNDRLYIPRWSHNIIL
jgi:hypothetical protein